MAKTIPLSQGLYALVDDADFERLTRRKWYARRTASGFYAMSNRSRRLGVKRAVFMHREIINAPPGSICDHVNGNTLDNRRENLRLATSNQNRMNARRQSNNKTGYKGVSYEIRRGRWRSDIRPFGEHVFLGYFDDPKSAAIAYNEAAHKYYGEFSRINQVD